MSQALSLNNPLRSIFIKDEAGKVSRYVILYIIGLALLTLSSKLMIPLQPVPVTLQTFAVLFIGMIYGARLGTATVVSFIALGLCGLPILANTTTGMSLGYLIGFIPAVYVAGILIQYGWGKSMLTTALAALIGTSIVLACGLAWLAIFIGFSAAINVGLMPFVGVELVKIALLAFTVPQFWKTVAV